MTVVVVGAGAIGTLVAGRLASAAEPVALLARPTTAAALAQQPLRIVAGGRMHVVEQLHVIAGAVALAGQQVRLAIVCVKGYDTEGVVPVLEALAPHAIVTLQNGIGNEELLRDRFGTGRVISGTITTSVEVEATGRVTVTKEGGVGLAPLDAVSRLHGADVTLRAAGFTVRTYDDYRSMKWSKVLLNVLGNATAAILGMPVEQVYADPRLIALERRMFLEIVTVMQRLGLRPVALPRYNVPALVAAVRYLPAPLLNPLLRRLVAGGRGGKPPSLQLDLMRGRGRSEGAQLYGAVAQAAGEVGVHAPVNEALWRVLNAIVTGTAAWDDYRGKPDMLLRAVSAS